MKHIFILDQLVILDDVRFNGTHHGYEFESSYVKLRGCLQGRLNSLRAQSNGKTQVVASSKLSKSKSSLLNYQPPSDFELRSLAKDLGKKMVGLVKRAPVEKPVLDRDGQTVETFIQNMGHVSVVNGVARQVDGQTLSSELQKVYGNISEIANQGSVKKNGRVIISLSARTDTKEKIIKKSLVDIIERLQTSSKQVLT
ncbi:MAG: hypothetical protein ACI9S8_001818 [Chlamydiales bacterium]|jgi:hypothetical protein